MHFYQLVETRTDKNRQYFKYYYFIFFNYIYNMFLYVLTDTAKYLDCDSDLEDPLQFHANDWDSAITFTARPLGNILMHFLTNLIII